ncbi:MAG: metalloregulator ArsR/SmtB family transcription factor [Thermaerobacter sp.]|nr:metalloregulator ArsR/SmtB family transcription factor [Thermaerobacter sp.]
MTHEEAAAIFKALGDPTRVRMVALLAVHERCVCEFVPVFGISQPAVSHHMRRLKEAGLVRESRRGQWVFYSLVKERLDGLRLDLEEPGRWVRDWPPDLTEMARCDVPPSPEAPSRTRKGEDYARVSRD